MNLLNGGAGKSVAGVALVGNADAYVNVAGGIRGERAGDWILGIRYWRSVQSLQITAAVDDKDDRVRGSRTWRERCARSASRSCV